MFVCLYDIILQYNLPTLYEPYHRKTHTREIILVARFGIICVD